MNQATALLSMLALTGCGIDIVYYEELGADGVTATTAEPGHAGDDASGGTPADPAEGEAAGRPNDDSGHPAGSAGRVTDRCDEPTYEGVEYAALAKGHFVFHFIPGTAAEVDLDAIAATRERAYDDIRAALGISDSPTIDVALSPSRVAAVAHHLGMGLAYPGWDHYEVVYVGAAGEYESTRYGHELAHVLAYHVDGRATHLPILEEGLAELLDGSQRDLHIAYAEQLTVGWESRANVASFDDYDVFAMNYGRAGSLVQLLVERYGLAGLRAIWRAAAIEWHESAPCHPRYGCADSADALAAVLDGVLTESVGEPFAAVQPAWREAVDAALAVPALLGDADAKALAVLLAASDEAMNNDDVGLYRSTMEGYYCEWRGEAGRMGIAARAVSAFVGVHSQALAFYPLGTRSFPAALAVATRSEARGTISAMQIYFERGPLGWRVIWSDDWR